MNYQTWINRALIVRGFVEHAADVVAERRAICERVTPIYGVEFTQPTRNRGGREENIEKLIEAQKELTRYIDQYDAICSEIRHFLYTYLPVKYADSLDWIYCNGKSISEIAEIRGISYSAAACRRNRAEKKASVAYQKFIERTVSDGETNTGQAEVC